MATTGLLGYADRLSVRAGERIRFMVSTTAPAFRVEIVRLDRGPRTPGVPTPATTVDRLDGEFPGGVQRLSPGSCVVIPDRGAVRYPDGMSLRLWVQPSMPLAGVSQGIAAHAGGDGTGWALWLDEEGRLAFRVGAASQPLRSDRSLARPGSWYAVVAVYDAARGEARLHYREVRTGWLPAAAERLAAHSPAVSIRPGDGTLLFGALALAGGVAGRLAPAHCFNGKIDRPSLWGRALPPDEAEALVAGAAVAPAGEGAIGVWDFSHGIATTRIHDTSPNALHGWTVNAPMRGVTGASWDGSAASFRVNPAHYGAIAFHVDDLDDAGWEERAAYDVPVTLRSGLYAARLTAGDGPEWEEIPFYVRPAAGAATAPVLYLAPTNTYLAYANERLHTNPQIIHFASKVSDVEMRTWPWQEVLAAYPELGASCYDRHPDGTGVCFSSRLRPVVTMRSDFVNGMTDCSRHFSSDLYLIEWLERLGIPYDVATDEDLHLEGAALLAPYRALLTGSHPEYWTTPMMDGLEVYLSDGGRLLYLGGNGFYWVTAIDPARPHLIEVRRTNAGTRSWDSAPGECDLSLTGEPGGLWRHRGRSPHRLTGVGFAAEGWCGAPGYRRLPDSFRPEAAWVFAGVGSEERIGDFGLVMGGAAGDEIDRYDLARGTPPETLRLATSEGAHSDCYQLVVEDLLMTLPGVGGSEHPDVRADLTLLDLPNGGAIFATGSINWSGSLPAHDFANNVARITENVLRRFAGLETTREASG